MPLTRFDPPGFLDDLDDAARAAWSDWISQSFDAVRDRTGNPNEGPRPQFFNPLTHPPGPAAVERDISWTAFPRVVQIKSASDTQRWTSADASRDRQDEYCEWSVERDPAGTIRRVTFTSESPEYWEFLARVNPDRVLELYRTHVNPTVSHEDLFPGGNYEKRNRWNQSTHEGAMHLIQGANTLGAEIELAAAATLVRRRNGTILTAEPELIDCGRYGERERFSDPHIGGEVNALARQKADVTLANPVGLCIAGLSTAGWECPDASDPSDFWRVTRGTTEKALRAVYEVPDGRGFQVGDVKIGGNPIRFGGQIADFITIKLTGLATRFGASTAEPVGCVLVPEQRVLEGIARVPSVSSVLERAGIRSRR